MRMMMPRAIGFDMQMREAAPFWHRVFACNDAGLICAAAEQLAFSPPDQLAVLFPPEVQQQAAASLHPVRDLEAVQLIEGLAAKRDGRATPMHSSPPFNHPIDPTKLRALKQGQRYRVTTDKGTIILATDVNDCPGSSLAFDSLVTAGYYNGKAFHRMVPNFVVQGGCPRGDGYGGMPWTLRTEIGRKLFTAGSVGLASAGRDTESCQFFITHVATPHLDGRYTRFGEVVEGMDVVMRLEVGDVMRKVERLE
jgi:cyclophilin family peptidyl-prolyl cis-trans isomerase